MRPQNRSAFPPTRENRKAGDAHRDATREIDPIIVLRAPVWLPLQFSCMPLTVFDIKGLPGHRRERIEAAVVAGGKHTKAPHEAWIAADPFKGGFRVLMTGPHGFERTVTFALDDDPSDIAERVRETLEE
jgi:hypothetical protein